MDAAAILLLTNITRSPRIARREPPGRYPLDPVRTLLVKAHHRLHATTLAGTDSSGELPDRPRAFGGRLERLPRVIAECRRLAADRPSRHNGTRPPPTMPRAPTRRSRGCTPAPSSAHLAALRTSPSDTPASIESGRELSVRADDHLSSGADATRPHRRRPLVKGAAVTRPGSPRGRCSVSSNSAASGRSNRCAKTPPLRRSRSLTPALLVVVRSSPVVGEEDSEACFLTVNGNAQHLSFDGSLGSSADGSPAAGRCGQGRHELPSRRSTVCSSGSPPDVG